MMTKLLLRGVIDFDGSVKATPVVVTLDGDGNLLEYEYLGSCEPHSTRFDSKRLLNLKSKTVEEG